MKRILCLLTLIFLIGFTSHSVHASSRDSNKFGFTYDLLGHPLLSLAGYNLAWHPTGRFRVAVGYSNGDLTSGLLTYNIETVGAHALFFLLDWNFTPFVGVGYGSTTLTLSAGSGDSKFGIGAGTVGLPYISYGFDWVTNWGLSLAFGINPATKLDASLPYFSIGFFF